MSVGATPGAATWPPGSGELARLVREHDWAGTPLGPARGWPDRLKAAVEQMLESPLVATLACGPERVLLYNDAASGLYGDRHPGALGRPLSETWPEAYASVARLYDRAFGGEAVQVPAQPLDVSRAGGEVFDVTLTPVRDGLGAVMAVHMTGFEVGARLRAEASLRESETRYRTLFDTMGQGYCELELVRDADGRAIDQRYIELNPAFERLIGVPVAEARGRKASEVVPRLGPIWHDAFDRVARTGTPERVEHRVASLGRWFEVFAYPRGGDRLVVLYEDVTDRKHADEALRASEERFRAFVTASSDLVYRMGPDWTEMQELDGRGVLADTAEPSGAWMDLYIRPEDRPAVRAVIDEAVRTRSLFRLEHRVRRADGGTGWVLSRAVPILDGRGEIAEWLGAASDVTARREAEERLRASEERQAFLLRLSDALRPLAGPAEIEGEACRLLAEHLDVDRACYVEVDEGLGLARVERDFVRGGAPSLAGRHRVADFGWAVAVLRRGEGHAVADTQASPLVPPADRPASAALGIVACMGAPLIREGRLAGALCVTASRPRSWAEPEVELLREAAERISAAVERARAEASLRDTEAQLQGFGEASSDVLWIRDAETLDWTYLSPAFERIYGLSRDEALRGDTFRNWLDLVLPEDRGHARSMVGRAQQGERVTFEYRITRPSDGALRTMRDTDFPIRDAGGRVTRIGGVGHDVTAEQAAQGAIEDGERRLRSLMEGIPQLVWTAVDGGRWTWSSPQWSAYTGLTEEESRGGGWLEAIHPDDRAAARAAWEGAAERGGLSVEYRVRHAAEGAYHWFQTRATPVRDASGGIVEWLGTSTDVQELKELTDRQGVLVAELQHRTRNLLSVVRSVTDKTLAGSRSLPDFQARIRDRLGALARVNGLLSRLHEGERVTFDELLLAELRGHGVIDGDGRGRQVRLSGPKGVALRSSTVQTFALGLHELATNALKYGALSRPEGRLTVAWEVVAGDGGGEDGRGGAARLRVDWREEGVAVPASALDGDPAGAPEGSPGAEGAPPRRRGYGRELIERALPYQLDAETAYEITPAGVRCAITLPIQLRDGADDLPRKDPDA